MAAAPPEFGYHAFISYAREDKDWALRLHADLTNRGLDVFLDQRGLLAGREWNEQLTEGIRKSRHAIILWSAHARASDWVLDEIARSRNLARGPADRRLIPVYLD